MARMASRGEWGHNPLPWADAEDASHGRCVTRGAARMHRDSFSVRAGHDGGPRAASPPFGRSPPEIVDALPRGGTLPGRRDAVPLRTTHGARCSPLSHQRARSAASSSAAALPNTRAAAQPTSRHVYGASLSSHAGERVRLRLEDPEGSAPGAGRSSSRPATAPPPATADASGVRGAAWLWPRRPPALDRRRLDTGLLNILKHI